MDEREKYEELVHKVRSTHESFRKWQRKIMNEPESESKYDRVELMQKVIDRSAEIINWWNNYEAKMIRREQRKLEQQREAAKKKKKEAAYKKIAEYERKLTEPQPQRYNTMCRYYYQCGKERKCTYGMDMTYCSERCAFATNMPGSTRAYDAPVIENHRIKKRRYE